MRLFLTLLLMLAMPLAQAARVAFVSPGRSDETFWATASQAMQHAARDLGLELRVYHAERDPLRQIALVRGLTGPVRPDYLLVAGEKGTLAQQLRTANSMGIPTLLVYNGVQPAEREVLGRPRGRLKHWLGSLVPQAENAGYMTARTLIEAGLRKGMTNEDGQMEMIALYGDRSSDTSVKRNQGLARALQEYPQVVMRQAVSADWQRDKAHLQATHLFRRYPEARLVWTASDQIAFGAMQAAIEEGLQPGRELLFSALNTSDEAMHAIIDGRLNVLAGGHFMAGAWGLVLLHDYHHGQDFIELEGSELERPMFSLFDAALAQRYLQRDQADIDFRRFSKVHNAGLAHYDFSFAAFLRGRP